MKKDNIDLLKEVIRRLDRELEELQVIHRMIEDKKINIIELKERHK